MMTPSRSGTAQSPEAITMGAAAPNPHPDSSIQASEPENNPRGDGTSRYPLLAIHDGRVGRSGARDAVVRWGRHDDAGLLEHRLQRGHDVLPPARALLDPR